MRSKETVIDTDAPDRGKALRIYREAAEDFDRGVKTLSGKHQAIRARAIRELQLVTGDTVIDVGCGTGLSFPELVHAVGPQGQVVGVDQSPEMLAQARKLIDRARWSNVLLVNASAAEAKFQPNAAAALFYYSHDIMRERAALMNIIAHLKPGARVVAVGIKWARWWNVPINLTVLRRAWRFVTTFDGLRTPWSNLHALTDELRVESLLAGGAYIACAKVRESQPGAAR